MTRPRSLVALTAACLLACALSSAVAGGATPNLQGRIDATRGRIQAKRGEEQVLTSTIAGYTSRIDALQSDITVLQTKEVRIQARLDAERAELASIQADLRAERIRLVRLRARLAEARRALSARLVALYKADQPDVITVILESDGFADLLERTEFMRRVSDQDGRIIDRVRIARAEAKAAEVRLDALEARQSEVTARVGARRDEVAAVKSDLVDRRDEFASVRAGKQSALASTQASRQDLEGDLEGLEAEQAKIQARVAAAQSGSSGSAVAGPVRQGSGSFIWPVDGPVVSPFGMRWGRLHAGVDIAVPTGTPIRAADDGTVILMGPVSGYGNYTCVDHGGGISTCYAHQSAFGTSMGASVSKGQVIGYVGCTGHCFGPHLHFEVRVNGVPTNPLGYL